MPALIGLLGGTFDPPHRGHLAIARHLLRALDADSVRLVLNAVPPHRTPPACPARHRLAMLEAAITGEPGLLADARELARIGPSYTLWTLRALRREFAHAALCWIVGADAWLGLERWHRWYEISSLAHLVVVRRPGWTLGPDTGRRLDRDIGMLRRDTAGARVLCDGPDVDVSASDIRRRLAAGEDVSAVLPAPVCEYIEDNGLYGRR